MWVENAENSDNKCWFAGTAFKQNLNRSNRSANAVQVGSTLLHFWFEAIHVDTVLIHVISRPAFFHRPLLCPGHHCCGAFLRLLYAAGRLHRAQGLHQPQPHPLRHHLYCLHPTQDTGTVWTSLKACHAHLKFMNDLSYFF